MKHILAPTALLLTALSPAVTEVAAVSGALATQRAGPAMEAPGLVAVTVDCAKVLHTMRGGMGASWHAMETEIPYGVQHPRFSSYSHGGSGWGAYPPAEDERAWQQIYRHAEWLGLDWNRVEIEQRVYQPERDQFTFDSPEMRILYRILDWHQRQGADVFFQQMWCNTAWLAYPEFRDDPVGRVHSAPYDVPAFADGLATLMEHLIKKRGYTCIKWLCINNEPGAGFSWWQAPPNRPLSIKDGLVAVRAALDRRGLELPLSGPDMSVGFPAEAPGPFDYLGLLGAYDFHDYGADFDFRTQGHMAKQVRNADAWASLAHREGKPLFLSEYGTMAYGWVPDKPGPGSPRAVLAGAELVIRLAHAGVDGFNRWSFLNRGDLDGQWQLVDTWDRQQKKLLPDFPPHPNSYFCIGLLSRFTARNSAVLASRLNGGNLQRDGSGQRVFAAAFRSPGGQYTLAVVNDAPVQFPLKLAVNGLSQPATFHRYRFGEPEYDRPDVRIEPQSAFTLGPAGADASDTLPPNSLTLYSTYELDHDAPGIVAEPSPPEFPVFRYHGVVLEAAQLTYRPHDDVIYPSVVRVAGRVADPLGKFYLYYAPHDAPGGICLAYADKPEGPWREYTNSPIISREWAPHYRVSHVSGPDAIWSEDEGRMLLYFHGENPVTRVASSRDGIHFDYEGEAVATRMFPNLSEASYGRVFRHALPGKDNRYVMLLMGNDRGTRRIYMAWSRDGRQWDARPTPVLNPPAGTDQVAGAVLWPWAGKLYLIAHANNSKAAFNQGYDLYVAETDAALEHVKPRGIFLDRTFVAPDNPGVMSPCLVEDEGRWYLFFNIGPRLRNKVALAVAGPFTAPAPEP
jgi:hypothetical protein